MKGKKFPLFWEKKIKSLSILFENCELYTIPYKEVERFNIEGISLTLDSIISYLSCSKVLVTFTEEALRKDYGDWKEGISLRQRLDYLDVVAVEFTYEDGQEVLIYVPWEDKGTDQTTNSCMYLKNENTFCIEKHVSVAQ